MSRVELDNDNLVIRTDSKLTRSGAVFRPVGSTAPMLGRVVGIPQFISVLIDNRAPGMYASVIGGPTTKMEYLAEVMVSRELVVQVADKLADYRFLTAVNSKLVRGNQRMKAGVLVIDHNMLFEAIVSVTEGGESEADEGQYLARVLTALISMPYMALNVMVPFVGAVEYKYFDQPVADLGAIAHAARVADVTEVLETIELGAGFKGAKEFIPSLTESILSPVLMAASNRLMTSLMSTRMIYDAATIVGMHLLGSPDMPEHLRDHPDLAVLASNASFAIDAIQRVGMPISTPDFDMRTALAHTTLRLRELRRFTSMPLRAFRDMYSHDVVLTPSGKVCGTIVWRNESVSLRPQVTRFIPRANYVTQSAIEIAETYMRPMTDVLATALKGSILQDTVSVAFQHLITRRYESEDLEFGGYAFCLGLTEIERTVYGISHADRLVVTDISVGENGDAADFIALPPRLLFEVLDQKAAYTSGGVYTGTTVLTDDPLEVLMLNLHSFKGSADFVVRPQTFLDDTRHMIIAAVPDESTVISLERKLKIEVIPVRSTVETLRLDVSLQDLLALSDLGELFLTIERAPAKLLNASIASLIYAYDEVKLFGERIDSMMARQIATAMHALWGRIADQQAFTLVSRSLFLRFIQTATLAPQRHMLREALADASVKHQIVLNIAAMLLVKTGLLQYGLHEDVAKIFTDEDVVEIAVTGSTWQRVMAQRV